jgi:hypothetical protein
MMNLESIRGIILITVLRTYFKVPIPFKNWEKENLIKQKYEQTRNSILPDWLVKECEELSPPLGPTP